MLLEAREFVGRLLGRPDPTAIEVGRLKTLYEETIGQVLGDQNYVSFTVDAQPTQEDFPSSWVWPYWRDLFPPITITLERRLDGSVLDAVSNEEPVTARFKLRGNNPVLQQRIDLPYIYPTVYYEGDSWGRRRAWLEFGVDLARFVLKHQPSAERTTT